jgi:hypothetical protein
MLGMITLSWKIATSMACFLAFEIEGNILDISKQLEINS